MPRHRLGLQRRDPLEQFAPGHEHPDQGADDGVGHEPGLLREQGQTHQTVDQTQQHILSRRAQMGAERKVVRGRDQPMRQGEQGGHRQRGQHQADQQGFGRLRDGPGAQQHQQHAGRREGAAEVVQHLPAAEKRHAPSADAENPGQQLPVTARPPVGAGIGHFGMGRKLVENLDIADQSAAGEHALEQVVAELGIVRHPPGQRRLEDVHVVNAFPGIGAKAE